MGRRVLFAGRGQLPTINIVASYLKQCDPELAIDVLDPFLPSGEPFGAESVQYYDRLLNSPEVDFESSGWIRKSWRAILAAAAAPSMLIRHMRAHGLAGARYHLYVAAASNVRRKWYRKAFADYSVIHIHGLFHDTLAQYFVDNFRSEQHVVVTFWGSDLFRQAGVEMYRRQYEILRRADVITIGSPEMSEVVLSKFGRDLRSKLRTVVIGLPDATIQFIRSCERSAARARIGALLGAPADRVWIKLGYSNDREQRYVEIIRELNSLPDSRKRRVYFLVPMAYGAGGASYIAEVERALHESGLDGKVISEYLAKEDALRVSVACEVMLNLRTTDAFNNSMCESLLAGRIVVNGAWLPYGVLRTCRIHVVELPDISQIARCLADVISDLAGVEALCSSNPQRLTDLVSAGKVAQAWRDLYR